MDCPSLTSLRKKRRLRKQEVKELTWLLFQEFKACEGLTSLQDLSDASIVGLELHLELGQFLVQFAQVTVDLMNTHWQVKGSFSQSE